MTQQPFSRPGAIDLSALKRPPAPAATPGAGGASAAGGVSGGVSGGVAGGAGGAAYVVDVTEATFQATVEASMTAPVLLVFSSPSRLPESVQMADDLASLADEFDGRFLVGRVDIDASPAIAQAVQLQSVPFVFAVIDGRPAPLIQDVLGLDELRTALTQVVQQLTTQGITGRHQPRSSVVAEVGADAGDDVVDPRYAPAEDALSGGDYAGAVAEYEKLLAGNPADAEAAAGLAMARVLLRTDGVDADAATAAADAAPDDVDAHTLAADLDLVVGQVEASFARLVDLVRRTSGADRDRAREHLIGLFAAVGNDDPLVLQARRALASALF